MFGVEESSFSCSSWTINNIVGPSCINNEASFSYSPRDALCQAAKAVTKNIKRKLNIEEKYLLRLLEKQMRLYATSPNLSGTQARDECTYLGINPQGILLKNYVLVYKTN